MKPKKELVKKKPSVAERKVSEAARKKRKLCGLDCTPFEREDEAVWLPFPGLDSSLTGDRPPREFYFVGRKDYPKILRKIVFKTPYSGLTITGPKGCGKSAILAVHMFASKKRPDHFKVICIFFFDKRKSLDCQIRDALFFTYSEDPSAAADISKIEHPATLGAFLKKRKEAGDHILLMIDGPEKFDSQNLQGESYRGEEAERRAAAREWLAELEKHSAFTVIALSPQALDAVKKPLNYDNYELGELFSQDGASVFLQETILDCMLQRHPERLADVEFYAGRHPLSLFHLNGACEEYVNKRSGGLRFGFSFEVEEEDEEQQDTEEKAEYLDDKADWLEVLALFKKSGFLEEVRASILSYSGKVENLRDPASVFKGYVLGRSFCTQYLHAVHHEAALQKRHFSTSPCSGLFQRYTEQREERTSSGPACCEYVPTTGEAPG